MNRKMINKKIISFLFCLLLYSSTAYAQQISYTVKPGDSMWKIAVKYQIGVSEIIDANPKVKNPNFIYPGQQLNIPNINNVKSLENEVVRLVNMERAKYNLPALKQNWELSRIARYKSQDMIDKSYFSHNSPTYGSPFTMIQNFGIKFSSAGENIAYGQNSPAAVMNSWMNSPGHRNNILSPSYTEIGVGLAKNNKGVYYWTQMFIKPMY